ncbi:MAG: BrnT family toxin [Bryobacteraceae bacterium]
MGDALNFDWDAGNTQHLALHGVSPAEAEEVIRNNPIQLAVQIRSGEERILCAGKTESGRALQIVYTVRRGRIRVVTGHTADKKVRRIL